MSTMQLICESYQLMKDLLGLSPDELQKVYAKWNRGVLDSYLIEITADIFGFKDPDTGKPLVDFILDTAGQKGTGKWTVDSATDNGVALTLIAEAVFSRCLSAQKDERVAASKILAGPSITKQTDREQFVNDVEMALYASKIISYAQGYALMRASNHSRRSTARGRTSPATSPSSTRPARSSSTAGSSASSRPGAR